MIHAIELYLNAFLLAQGYEATAIRGMQHNLAKRAEMLRQSGMVLKVKTAEHLMTLSERREYLAVRYSAPDQKSLSQLNRLQATMEEIRRRVIPKITPPVGVTASVTTKQAHSHSIVPGGLLVTS